MPATQAAVHDASCQRGPALGVQALLKGAVAAPDEPVDQVKVLTDGEVEALLHGFNATDMAPSELMHPGQTVHGVLEHWAAVQPDAPAAVFEVQSRSVLHRLVVP